MGLTGCLPFLVVSVCVKLTIGDDYDSQGFFKRDHSIVKPYLNGMSNYDIVGATQITDNHVRLTSDVRSQVGAIWVRKPNLAVNWEIILTFAVHGHGGKLYGDGFAFWYLRNYTESGKAFGSSEYFSGLGIFFDTYNNHNGEHSVNNGSIVYDHDHDGTHSEVAGCTSYFRGDSRNSVAILKYIGSQRSLSLKISTGDGEYSQCFDVGGINLPTGYYFGLTAVTGELSDNHDIISMKVFDLDHVYPVDPALDYRIIVPYAIGAAPHRDRVEDEHEESSGWLLKVFLFIIATIITAAVLVAIIVYVLHRRERMRKRFY